MTFQETLDFLYHQLPVFHREGAAAYKKDLTRTLQLLEYLGNPQLKLKFVHVAGTNGKGSSSHMLASVLQEAGYLTGLYTSPHLKHFGERIRINGQMVEEDFVVRFVKNISPLFSTVYPSFFELTVAMAFQYFYEKKVDIVITEAGLGGRLDSTNVILPEACLITNISYDHMDILGSTLKEIALEKAGIIKAEVPVVISERQSETVDVFVEMAAANKAPIVFASDHVQASKTGYKGSKMKVRLKHHEASIDLLAGLAGGYQLKNIAGVWSTCQVLVGKGYSISEKQIKDGISKVVENTGLKGRWQVIEEEPFIVCDIAHNEGGIKALLEHLQTFSYAHLHLVLGMVRDKDIQKVLALLPQKCTYYFSQSISPRALPAEELQHLAEKHGLKGEFYPEVNIALRAARKAADKDDMILVCGSAFLIAEVNEV